MPNDFAPSSVISCQVSDGRDDITDVAEVTLSGNIDALVKALSSKSERTDENTSVSCAVGTYAPAAIWLVSANGAVRAAWPTVVCGFRDEPLAPLEALSETGRRTVHTLRHAPSAPGALPTSICNGYTGAAFHTTEPGHGGGTTPRKKERPTLRLPDGPAAGLTACTYRVSRSTTGYVEPAVDGQVRLSAVAASRLIREALAAPQAEPCDRDATEIIAVDLYRPDGSGGGTLSAEADGCRRLTVSGLTGYRTASGSVTALLRDER